METGVHSTKQNLASRQENSTTLSPSSTRSPVRAGIRMH